MLYTKELRNFDFQCQTDCNFFRILISESVLSLKIFTRIFYFLISILRTIDFKD